MYRSTHIGYITHITQQINIITKQHTTNTGNKVTTNVKIIIGRKE